MDDKSRDSALGAILFILGFYIVGDSALMLRRAAGPPHRIASFGLSPGMFPLILGLLLLLFAGLLVRETLKGEGSPWRVLRSRLRTTFSAMRSAFGDDDFLSMFIGVILLFVYCFAVLGNLPFWSGSVGFLLILMTFLRFARPMARFVRAANLGVIVLAALASASLIVFLFEDVFGTVLP